MYQKVGMPFFRSQGEMFGSKSWVFWVGILQRLELTQFRQDTKMHLQAFGGVFAENLGFPEEVFRVDHEKPFLWSSKGFGQ